MSLETETRPTARTGRALLGVLLVFSVSCTSATDATTSGEPPNQPPPVPPATPAPAPRFPDLSRPGVIYAGDDGLYDVFVRMHGSRLASRYVLYDDHTFELQFSSARFGFFAYTGRVAKADSRLTFDWDGWSAAGPWGASATVRGDSLDVEYNLVMQLTDFIDGVYVRVPAAP